MKKSIQFASAILLALLVVMEGYSLAAIALDRFPSHRPWWEYCGIALSWVMLAALLIGFALLFNSKTSVTGLRLVIVNIVVCYGITLFAIFAYATISKVSFLLLAIYSGIALVEVLAATSLKKLVSSASP
jgi:hypothetical protein